VLVFCLLGFAFGAWAGVIVAMIVVGLVGTYAGKLMLNRMSDRNFKIALDGLLILISLRLIYQGFTG
jgi:putative Ca2+/H+ antiporter (TMEM165/GDT1 family)